MKRLPQNKSTLASVVLLLLSIAPLSSCLTGYLEEDLKKQQEQIKEQNAEIARQRAELEAMRQGKQISRSMQPRLPRLFRKGAAVDQPRRTDFAIPARVAAVSRRRCGAL